METVPSKDYILLPLWPADLLFSQSSKSSLDDGFKPSGDDENKVTEEPRKEGGDSSKEDESDEQEKDDNINNTNNVNTVSSTVNAAGIEVNVVDLKTSIELPDDCLNWKIFPILTTKIHKDHPVEQISADIHSAPQTRRMTKSVTEHAMFNEPKKVIQALKDPSWIEAIWTLMDLPNGKRAIGTKWMYRNKKDERAIRLFLAYASFKDFVVYQMDVKSAFLYGKIEEEVCVCQPPRFKDPDFPDKVYKVEKALYGLHQAPRACDVKTACTPMETHTPLLKDEDGEDVDEHLYRSMIGSLMYLTSSRPDIMFVVCACARFQVNPKSSHLHAVKRIFRYLKDQPKLGLWYPKDSPFDLVACTDSDYVGASLYRKSTTVGCQFLGCRLISWQCKKQTVDANSTTEVKYIAASNCCGQVLWIQNQLLDYGYNFMQTKIHIDNERCLEWNEKAAKDEIGDTVKAKTVNGEVQMQALVDKKKVIITESTIRRDLQLEDANGVDCLPNAAIFEQAYTYGTSVRQESKKVLDLETSKTTQALEMESLKRRVKKLDEEEMI
ncbi:putative reverse transcriptase, RNA-dependent DNA polymerase [Tanacetum coccineum]